MILSIILKGPIKIIRSMSMLSKNRKIWYKKRLMNNKLQINKKINSLIANKVKVKKTLRLRLHWKLLRIYWVSKESL